MAPLRTDRFLSLIPTLHESAVITDESAVASAPTSPEVKPVDPTEKTRRSSSSASTVSMPGDAAKEVGGMQFLKLGN